MTNRKTAKKAAPSSKSALDLEEIKASLKDTHATEDGAVNWRDRYMEDVSRLVCEIERLQNVVTTVRKVCDLIIMENEGDRAKVEETTSIDDPSEHSKTRNLEVSRDRTKLETISAELEKVRAERRDLIDDYERECRSRNDIEKELNAAWTLIAQLENTAAKT